MCEVAQRVAERYDVVGLAAVHRVGDLAVGDLAVVVAVARPHRGEAFDACRELIDELKATVPIWKHQMFRDGSEEWVGTPYAATRRAARDLRLRPRGRSCCWLVPTGRGDRAGLCVGRPWAGYRQQAGGRRDRRRAAADDAAARARLGVALAKPHPTAGRVSPAPRESASGVAVRRSRPTRCRAAPAVRDLPA